MDPGGERPGGTDPAAGRSGETDAATDRFPAPPLLFLDDLSLRVGDFSLQGISLRVLAGEFHVLLGPSGAGKTLLLETVAGFLRPASGRILSGGLDITAFPPEKRGFSYLPQDLALFPHLTVEENVCYGLRWRKSRSREEESHLATLIRVTGIGPLLRRRPGELSGGEKQRVALVRSLAVRPRLLLMDEPLSALHPQLRAEIRRLLGRLHRELGFTALLVTHDLEDAFALGDGASVLLEGRLYTAPSVERLYRYPPSTSVARFFGLPNLFPAAVEAVRGGEVALRVEGLGPLLVRLPEGFSPPRPGERIFLGLHPEEITLVKPDRRHLPRKNLFSGRIARIFPQGRSFCLLFSTARTVLEIHVPAYALEKLPVHEGWEGEVEIKEDKAFLMPN